jgi:hypothetical protein
MEDHPAPVLEEDRYISEFLELKQEEGLGMTGGDTADSWALWRWSDGT